MASVRRLTRGAWCAEALTQAAATVWLTTCGPELGCACQGQLGTREAATDERSTCKGLEGVERMDGPGRIAPRWPARAQSVVIMFATSRTFSSRKTGARYCDLEARAGTGHDVPAGGGSWRRWTCGYGRTGLPTSSTRQGRRESKREVLIVSSECRDFGSSPVAGCCSGTYVSVGTYWHGAAAARSGRCGVGPA